MSRRENGQGGHGDVDVLDVVDPIEQMCSTFTTWAEINEKIAADRSRGERSPIFAEHGAKYRRWVVALRALHVRNQLAALDPEYPEFQRLKRMDDTVWNYVGTRDPDQVATWLGAVVMELRFLRATTQEATGLTEIPPGGPAGPD